MRKADRMRKTYRSQDSTAQTSLEIVSHAETVWHIFSRAKNRKTVVTGKTYGTLCSSGGENE